MVFAWSFIFLKSDTIDFPLTSGIEIVDVNQIVSPLHQGDTTTLNITYTSSRPDDLNATTITSGDDFVEKISDFHIVQGEDEIDGKFESSIIVEVTADEEAELGYKTLDIIVHDNFSEAIFLGGFQIDIHSVVEVTPLLVDQYLVDFSQTDLMFSFYNHHLNDNESIRVEINSTAFDYTSTIIDDLLPLTQRDTIISLIPNDLAKMGVLDFVVSVWRDETIIFTKSLTIQAVPEIEILNIYSGNLQVIQGQAPTVTLQLFNYNSSSKQLYIKSNGDEVMGKIVSHGESRFAVELGSPIRNPYNLGEEIYQIEIFDELGNKLATKVITVNVKPSTLNIFLFYVLPILIPIGVILYFKYKELEQIKRTK